MRVVLDTTVLIDYLRGRPAVARVTALAEAGEEIYVTPIGIEEVVRGVRPRERPKAEALVAALLLAPISKGAARVAGDWRREYARRGRTLTQADCLVAAAAFAVGGTLATGNPKDFPMPGLTVEHWPVGS